MCRKQEQINAAYGEKKAELVLKNCKIVNVFTNEIEQGDLAIERGKIVGIGSYEGKQEVDLDGQIVCPAFYDGHIHIESSMLTPEEFSNVVVPHGTIGVITDPHEIANVAGTAGIDYMMQAAKDLPLDVYFMMPSCVPATGIDESGAELKACDLKPYYEKEQVLGLAEMMNSYGTVQADQEIVQKIADAESFCKMIDGHAPFITDKILNAYVTAGVQSDHECSQLSEALEKMKRGQWIMIRQGTAAQNMDALFLLFQAPFYERAMLVTDDKHPEDLRKDGHMDGLIRRAIKKGANPIYAIRMASLHTARYFNLRNKGAIAPNYDADLVVVDNLTDFNVTKVYKRGVLVAENGNCMEEAKHKNNFSEEIEKRVFHSFHLPEITKEQLENKEEGEQQRVIELIPRELLTKVQIVNRIKNTAGENNFADGVDLSQDIVKLAVLERHRNTGHRGIGFLKGYGLKEGAIASSIAHDSHNLMIVGVNDEDMVLAGNCVRKNGGGLAIAKNGKIIGELPLVAGGLMSLQKAKEVEEIMTEMKKAAEEMGIPEGIDPFMTLAFVSLPVIPEIRLNTYGLVLTDTQEIVPTFLE